MMAAKSFKLFCRASLASSLLLLSSCGYRWDFEYPTGSRPSIEIPFIPGDDEAVLTAEIISSLNAGGIAYIVPSKGDYRLEVKLLNCSDTQIGYRRDPQKIIDKIEKNLLASEGRKTLEAELTLHTRGEIEPFLGPIKLSVSVDYDYVDGDSYPDLTFANAAGKTVVVLPFSLGQLESIESAQEAAMRPLFRKLAQKIIDVISAEW